MGDFKNLDKLIKALKGKVPVAKVGILGSHAVRTAEEKKEMGPNNAEVGATHEFGTSKLPQRSFLRVPITENLQKYLEKSGALDKNVILQAIKDNSLFTFVKKLGAIGEAISLDSFDSGGFGKWKPSNMEFKKNKQTLVETQQLRNSISSEVKE